MKSIRKILEDFETFDGEKNFDDCIEKIREYYDITQDFTKDDISAMAEKQIQCYDIFTEGNLKDFYIEWYLHQSGNKSFLIISISNEKNERLPELNIKMNGNETLVQIINRFKRFFK